MPKKITRKRNDTDESDCTCPCDNTDKPDDCTLCMYAVCSVLKNPVVVVFFSCFCFIQAAIILTSITSSHAPHRTSYATRSARAMRKTQPAPKLDWQFKTVIKVDATPKRISTDKQLKHGKFNESKRLSVDPVIPYGSEDFQFPLLVDMPDVVDKVKRGYSLSVKPVNEFSFPFLISNDQKCANSPSIDIIIVIKSAPANSIPRNVIRETWGREKCWGGRIVHRLFLLGSVPKSNRLMSLITNESKLYADIVQADFIDHYYNNTYKLMMGFEWATKFCKQAKDLLFFDDDYFVQPKMIIAYLEALSPAVRKKHVAGYVWRVANPVRRKKGPHAKWFVSLNEYPWNTYPPYCSAGAFFVSMEVASDLVIAMKYTRYLRFDDVFLGLTLHKMLIMPMHLTSVYSFEPVDKKSKAFYRVMASHGYKDPYTLFTAWFILRGETFCVK